MVQARWINCGLMERFLAINWRADRVRRPEFPRVTAGNEAGCGRQGQPVERRRSVDDLYQSLQRDVRVAVGA